jgi:hypothetical protein
VAPLDATGRRPRGGPLHSACSQFHAVCGFNRGLGTMRASVLVRQGATCGENAKAGMAENEGEETAFDTNLRRRPDVNHCQI